MKTTKTQDQSTVYERDSQLVIALNSEIMIPENAPVRLTSAQLKELNYEKLYRAYSPKGRKSAADPRVLFEVLVYGYQRGIYSSRKLEEACRYRVDFMWLLGDERAPDHTTLARLRTGRSRDCVEELFYQYVRRLDEQGETGHQEVFIDGTKVESRAGRYTFVWRKNVEKHLEQFHQARYEEVTADAGYESLENYLYLDATGQTCLIKPANYDQKKSRKFRKQIGRVENMEYDPEEDCFTCAQGRKLPLRRECTERREGQFVTTAWYRCQSCEGCPCRMQCCRAKDLVKPKELVLQKTFWEKRAQAEENITTPRGVHLRLCRSIQAEGAFGLLKNDFAFRRFLTGGRANVRTELFLLALAFNLKKLWMKRQHGRLKTRCSEKMTA